MYNKTKFTNKKKWTTTPQKDNKETIYAKSKRPVWKEYILHVSNSITFWKRQRYRYDIKSSVILGARTQGRRAQII